MRSDWCARALVSAALFWVSPYIDAYTPSYGGGTTPAPVNWENFAAPQPEVHQDVGVSSGGSAQYAYAIELPPAIYAPKLGLSYGSDHGLDRELPTGWSLTGMLSIVRPATREYVHGELLLSGSATGTLVPVGSCSGTAVCYRAANQSSGDIDAVYDPATDSFAVHATDGRMWTLEAMDAGRSSGSTTALWRVTSEQDAHGNQIKYTYAMVGGRGPLLRQIAYGGNVHSGAAPVASVELSYTAGLQAATYVAGFVDDTYGAQLATIKVLSGSAPVARYTLTSAAGVWGGNRPMLTQIDKTTYDVTGASYVHPAVKLSYESPSLASARKETASTHAPAFFSKTREEVDSSAGPIVSKQLAQLIDMNRDGLADLVEADPGTGQWDVRYRRYDVATKTYDWKKPTALTMPAPPTIGLPAGGLPISQWDWGASGLVQRTVALTDLDGDRNPDLVSTWEWSYFDVFSRSYRSTIWGVYYGDGTGGFASAVTWEQAPTAAIEEKSNNSQEVSQVRQQLMDMNGDHYLDIVRAVPYSTDLSVYYHTGARGHGFQATPTALAAPWLREFAATGSGLSAGLSQADFHASRPGGAHFVDRTYQTGGFADINGDGLMDYVSSSALAAELGAPAGHWSVYYGLGKGKFSSRTDIGVGPSSVLSTSAHAQVRASADVQLSGLMDVNGDGWMDFVDFEATTWTENQGTQFGTAHALPAWLRASTTVAGLSASNNTLTTSGSTDTITTEVASMVFDLNHDRLPDLIEVPGVQFMDYELPNLLVSVEKGGLARADLSYLPASTTYPIGVPSVAQQFAGNQPLVATVETRDLVTAQAQISAYTYEDGYSKTDAFYGFGKRKVLHSTRDYTRATAPLVGSLVVEDYTFSTDLHGALLSSRAVYEDGCFLGVPSLNSGPCSGLPSLPVSIESWTHASFGAHVLPDSYLRWEYGEAGAYAKFKAAFTYDSHGLPLTVSTDGDGDGYAAGKDDVLQSYTWVHGSGAYPIYRMSSATTSGYDPLSGVWGKTNESLYAYDGAGYGNNFGHDGDLSDERVHAGVASAAGGLSGDVLDYRFTHDTRGQLTSIADLTRGATTAMAYGYGGAVEDTRTNALGQVTKRTLDAFGRVVRETDPNGKVQHTRYGASGDVDEVAVQSSLSAPKVVQKQIVTAHTAVPPYVRTTSYDQSGHVYAEAVEVRTGAGNPLQSWHTDVGGSSSWKVVGHGYANLSSNASRPVSYSGGFSIWSLPATPAPMAQRYADGLGRMREQHADATAGLGYTSTRFDRPREVIAIDPDGRVTTTQYDGYGRIIATQEGRAQSQTLTGQYECNPAGNLVVYHDANGNRYEYRYDGAGRLRHAKGPDFGTRTYTWDGAFRKAVIDSTGAWTSTQYDLIGRPVDVTMSDPTSVTPITYHHRYDAGWIGQPDSVSDAFGESRVSYDQYGRVSLSTRTYLDGMGVLKKSVSASTQWDAASEALTNRTSVSGRRYEYTYSGGELALVKEPLQGYRIAPTYTALGDVGGWKSSFLVGALWTARHTYEANQAVSPLFRSDDGLSTGSGLKVDSTYAWSNTGLLTAHDSKRVSGATLLTTKRSFGYDDFKHLLSVGHSTLPALPSAANESFAFKDPMGNLLTALDPQSATPWSYAALTNGNQLTTRTRGSDTETFAYDAAGRLSERRDSRTGDVQSYVYRGDGRLLQSRKNGVVVAHYLYDGNGALVAKSLGDPTVVGTKWEYTFGSYSYDERSGRESDRLVVNGLTAMAYVNGTREWLYTNYAGAVLAAVNDAGAQILAHREFSAYGAPVMGMGTQHDQVAFQGMPFEGADGLYAMGVRHMDAARGMFLQPEPLLLEGSMNQQQLKQPSAIAAYRFARSAPTSFGDQTGRAPATVGDRPDLELGSAGGQAGGAVPNEAIAETAPVRPLHATAEVPEAIAPEIAEPTVADPVKPGAEEVAPGRSYDSPRNWSSARVQWEIADARDTTRAGAPAENPYSNAANNLRSIASTTSSNSNGSVSVGVHGQSTFITIEYSPLTNEFVAYNNQMDLHAGRMGEIYATMNANMLVGQSTTNQNLILLDWIYGVAFPSAGMAP